MQQQITEKAQQLVDMATQLGKTVATAESCTGGMVSAAITEIPGSSAVLDRAFVTYSNQAKMDMLGITEETLQTHGAVSEQTATAMATGGQQNANVDICVAITGIAGPGGGSPEKPVGLVHFGCTGPQGSTHAREVFKGNRTEIRQQATLKALDLLLEALS